MVVSSRSEAINCIRAAHQSAVETLGHYSRELSSCNLHASQWLAEGMKLGIRQNEASSELKLQKVRH
ncbi:unnamed protein product [Protopolystoma xenopodis]|uniref:Uncharacterized protein n=1 Tax=Protopolystoma xenopodis TaxID=117903 RepID=A0A448WVZ4_9PLAT|nr:unnamed protein product [Protopolystoma xenopodis]